MPGRPTVIVFAKLPRRSRVKTRLARRLGDGAALRTYGALLRQTVRRLSDPRWRLVLAVTPDRAARCGAGGLGAAWPRLLPGVCARLQPQGPGDLGVRMARALRRAGPGPAVLVGSDIPDLDADTVARALSALGEADLVFGPAADGGFYLVGARHPGRVFGPGSRVFRGVTWSTPRTLAETRASVPPHSRVALIRTLEDLDE